MTRAMVLCAVAALSGCGAGLGAVRTQMDKNPTVAVTLGSAEWVYQKEAIPEAIPHPPMSDDFKAVAGVVSDALKAAWPNAKVGGAEAAAGADLVADVGYIATYQWLSNEAPRGLHGAMIRVEAIMKLKDKTGKQVGLWSMGVETKIDSGGDWMPMSTTLDAMMQRWPAQELAPGIRGKVEKWIQKWVNDVKAAKPAA